MTRDNTLVTCILCQRRVGLWAFAPLSDSDQPRTGRRQFDLLQEHRSYCPFVVKSTVVPSPSVPNDAQEGWKAVLTVVQRYGLGQRLGRTDDDGDRIQVDGVEAMVEGVKSHGGRDLLKYIKGLLG